MKRATCLASGVLLLATVAFAQMPPQQGAPQKISLAVSLQRGYASIKLNLTQGAEKMPESEYGFRPTPEVRTFGQLMGHAANAQFMMCAVIKGVANPNQGNDLEKKTNKAEFVKALADSVAFCDDAFSSLTDENAMQFVKQGQNETTRAGVLANLVAHSNETYGTAVVYMRLKGLVPPSTERMQQMMRPRGMD